MGVSNRSEVFALQLTKLGIVLVFDVCLSRGEDSRYYANSAFILVSLENVTYTSNDHVLHYTDVTKFYLYLK